MNVLILIDELYSFTLYVLVDIVSADLVLLLYDCSVFIVLFSYLPPQGCKCALLKSVYQFIIYSVYHYGS